MAQQTATSPPERRLGEIGLELPTPPTPAGNYVHWTRSGNLVFTAGQIPSRGGKPVLLGKVGGDVTLEQAQEAARICAVNGLAVIREAAGGTLDTVARVVKVTGFVAAAEGFTDIPKVVNGASDLLVEVFGEQGRHARSAVGVAELPLGVPVEVEFTVELAD